MKSIKTYIQKRDKTEKYIMTVLVLSDYIIFFQEFIKCQWFLLIKLSFLPYSQNCIISISPNLFEEKILSRIKRVNVKEQDY